MATFPSSQAPAGTRCSLRLSQVVPRLHHGDWTCQVETAEGDTGETKVEVSAPQEATVEFVNVWGHVTVDMAASSSPPFRCKVIAADPSGSPLRQPPGEMVWKLGDEVKQRSSQYMKVRSKTKTLIIFVQFI